MQENNSVSVPVATTPQVIEQPKQSNFLVILLTILLLISVAISGFCAYQTQELVKELNKLKTIEKTVAEDMSEPVATESSAVDPTADWKTYDIGELNLSLKLPSTLTKLGDWKVENLAGDTGNNVCFSLSRKSSYLVTEVLAGGVGICDGEHLRLNSNSVDYSAGRGGVFGDISGYRKLKGQFYPGIKSIEGQPPIPSELVTEITNKHGLTYLKVIGKDSVNGEWNGPIIGTPGSGSVGALILTSNSQYPGITVSANLSGSMTNELFDEILSTLKFLE